MGLESASSVATRCCSAQLPATLLATSIVRRIGMEARHCVAHSIVDTISELHCHIECNVGLFSIQHVTDEKPLLFAAVSACPGPHNTTVVEEG